MSRICISAIVALLLMTVGSIVGPFAAEADESSKTPEQLLADLRRDLGKVRSYHFSGFETDARSTTHLSGDVSAGGKADVTIREGTGAARLIVLPPASYMKANATYWKANGGAEGPTLARKLAGRWLKISDPGLNSVARELTPKHVASCAAVGTGTIRMGGVATVDGKRAVVLTAMGDKPGTAPGRLYVTAKAPVLPLRIQQTGKTRPGPIVKRCQDSGDSTSKSDVRFSAFDEPVHIRAPHGVITVPGASASASVRAIAAE